MPIKDNLNKETKITDTTATASEILEEKTAYIVNGKVQGTMTNNRTINVVLDTSSPSYTIPSGYHSGQGTVSITTQSKSATPTTSSQIITADDKKVLSSVSIGAIQTQTKIATPSTVPQTIEPDEGKYLSSVEVNAINTQSKNCTPSDSSQTISADEGKVISSVNIEAVTSSSGIGKTLYDNGYSTGSNAGYSNGYNAGVSATKVGTATANQVLSGYTFTNANSVGISGSMTNQGTWTTDGTPSAYEEKIIVIPAGYHDGNGYISYKDYYIEPNLLCSSSCYDVDRLCGCDIGCGCGGGLVIGPGLNSVNSIKTTAAGVHGCTILGGC